LERIPAQLISAEGKKKRAPLMMEGAGKCFHCLIFQIQYITRRTAVGSRKRTIPTLKGRRERVDSGCITNHTRVAFPNGTRRTKKVQGLFNGSLYIAKGGKERRMGMRNLQESLSGR